MPDIHNGYNFDTAIVGESNYKAAITKCYKDESNLNKQGKVYMDVALMLEDTNAYDKNAVAIVSKYGTIGYLARPAAIKYRKDYKGKDGLTVRAKIYPPKPNEKHYGIWLDLGDPEALNQSSTNKSNKNVVIKQPKGVLSKLRSFMSKK